MPLFDGQDEHDQIIRHVSLLGMPPAHLLDKSKKASKFFTRVASSSGGSSSSSDGEWQLKDPFPSSSSTAAAASYLKYMREHGPGSQRAAVNPRENLRKRLGSKFADTPVWHAFVDLMLQMLNWNSAQRIKPAHALQHSFFQLLRKQAEEAAAASAAAAAAATAAAHTLVESSAASAAAAAPLPSLAMPSAVTAVPAAALSAADVAAAPDTLMHDAIPALQPAAPAAPVSAPTVHFADESAPMDEDDAVAEKKTSRSGARPTVPSAHVTPTRKRHMQPNSPRSPSSAQHTPKTRALVKQHSTPTISTSNFPKSSPLTRAAAAAFDAEVEFLELPSNPYQSPSVRSLNRAATIPPPRSTRATAAQAGHAQAEPLQTRDTTNAAAAAAAAAAPSSAPRSRRSSENGHDQLHPSQQQPAPSQSGSPVIHNMLTRGKHKTLGSPSTGPMSPGTQGSWVQSQERMLASDPLALALDDRGQAVVALSRRVPSHLVRRGRGGAVATAAVLPATAGMSTRRKSMLEPSPESAHSNDGSNMSKRELRPRRRSVTGADDSGNTDMDEREHRGAFVPTRRTRARSHSQEKETEMAPASSSGSARKVSSRKK